jgi:hypothetical protein
VRVTSRSLNLSVKELRWPRIAHLYPHHAPILHPKVDASKQTSIHRLQAHALRLRLRPSDNLPSCGRVRQVLHTPESGNLVYESGDPLTSVRLARAHAVTQPVVAFGGGYNPVAEPRASFNGRT